MSPKIIYIGASAGHQNDKIDAAVKALEAVTGHSVQIIHITNTEEEELRDLARELQDICICEDLPRKIDYFADEARHNEKRMSQQAWKNRPRHRR